MRRHSHLSSLFPCHTRSILDSIAGIMQTFSQTYIPSGSLVVLVTQMNIPCSMVISKIFLKAKYQAYQVTLTPRHNDPIQPEFR